MIIKRVKPGAKSGLKRLLDYITNPEKEGQEKCTESQAIGDFLCDNLEAQKAELISTAYQAIRSPNPAEHFILSWRPGEIPTSEQVREAVEILAEELQCTGHQIMYGIHIDRDHIHTHAVINRATDDSITQSENLVDKQMRAIARICESQKWPPTPNQRYIIQNGQIINNPNKAKYNGQNISTGATRAEINTGIKSSERIAQEVMPRILKQAKNWSEMHQLLAKEGMRYSTKGSGAVIEVITEKGSQYIKASTAHKTASLSNMQKQYGNFEPSTVQEITPRKIETIEGAKLEQVQEYSRQKQERADRIAQAREQLKQQHGIQYAELKTRQQQEREQAKNSQNWSNKGHLLNAMRSAIAELQKKEREQLKTRQAQERKQITEQAPTFDDYQRQQERQQQEQLQKSPPLPRPERENDIISLLYKRHGQSIKKYLTEQGASYNDNTIDRMIAERLKETGIEREQIQKCLELNTQRGSDYAKRITEAVHSPKMRPMQRATPEIRQEWKQITKQATAEIIKATAKIAINPFTAMLQPTRTAQAQHEIDENERERNERDQLYGHLYQ